MKHAGRLLSLGLVAAFATGCYGKFTTTQNIYAFNRYAAPKDKWARTGIFLGMNLAPVYPTAVLIDVLLANPVEFWTGVNPIKGSKRWFPKRRSDAASATIESIEPGKRRVDLVMSGGRQSSFLVVHEAGDLRVISEETGDLVVRLDLAPIDDSN